MMKGGTSQNLTSCYFHKSWFYVEIMTQNVNLPIGPGIVLCLPIYWKNVQGPPIIKNVHMVYNSTRNRATMVFLLSLFALENSMTNWPQIFNNKKHFMHTSVYTKCMRKLVFDNHQTCQLPLKQYTHGTSPQGYMIQCLRNTHRSLRQPIIFFFHNCIQEEEDIL